MMTLLKLHQADLSVETLRSIQKDLHKYQHLKAYEKTYQEVCEYISVRDREQRVIRETQRREAKANG